MKEVDIDFIVYLEGYQVPAKSITVTKSINQPTECVIVLPTTDKIIEVQAGTLVHAFYFDAYKQVYRLMFDGIIKGPGYSKSNSKKDRKLYAVSSSSILNDIPTKYLAALQGEDFIQSGGAYTFYHIPTDERSKQMIKQNAIDADFTLGNLKNLTAVQYFEAFLKLLSNSWEHFYKNANTRMKIVGEHAFFDEGLYENFQGTQSLASALNLMNQAIVGLSDADTLAEILTTLKTIGYDYIEIPTPAYQSGGAKTWKSDADKLTIKYSANTMLKYILIPALINIIPPKCNVILSGEDGRLDERILDPVVTRLKYLYKMGDGTLMRSGEWPPGLIKERTGDEKYSLMESEYDTGMKPFMKDMEYYFNKVLGEKTFKPGVNEEEVKNNDMWVRKLAYDFENMQHSSNAVSIQLFEFNPYIVTGMPGIILDTTSGTAYYGDVVQHSMTIDQDKGRTITSVMLNNARVISSLEDIGPQNPFLDPSFFNKNNIDEHIYGELLKGTNDVANDLGEPDLVYLTDYGKKEPVVPPEQIKLYRRQKEYNGHEIVWDGTLVDENPSVSISGMLSGAGDAFTKDEYNRREIITLAEYFIAKGIYTKKTNKKEKYELKYMDPPRDILVSVTDPNKFIATRKDNATIDLDKNKYFIKERRIIIKTVLNAEYDYIIIE